VQAADQMRKQAGLLPNPRLIYQSENWRSGADPGQDVDTYAYASQLIETSGKRGARVATAQSFDRRANLQAEQQGRVVRLSVAQAYWEAVHQQYLKRVAEQNVTIYRETLDYQEKRFHEGKLAEVDLLRVRLEEARVEATSEAVRLAEAQARQRLAREMGQTIVQEWNLTERFDQVDSADSGQGPASERVEVRLAREAVATARANLMTQKAAGRPDLDALLGYKRTSGYNTWLTGLQMNLPLFDRNQHASEAARFNIHSSEATLEAVEQATANESALAQMAYDSWRRQVSERYGPLLARAEEIANISRAAYREGGTDLLRLLDAERLRIDTQNAWVEALANYHQSLLSLQYAQGVEP
jgi:outer membrane protein, heavy metal efflux system